MLPSQYRGASKIVTQGLSPRSLARGLVGSAMHAARGCQKDKAFRNASLMLMRYSYLALLARGICWLRFAQLLPLIPLIEGSQSKTYVYGVSIPRATPACIRMLRNCSDVIRDGVNSTRRRDV